MRSIVIRGPTRVVRNQERGRGFLAGVRSVAQGLQGTGVPRGDAGRREGGRLEERFNRLSANPKGLQPVRLRLPSSPAGIVNVGTELVTHGKGAP